MGAVIGLARRLAKPAAARIRPGAWLVPVAIVLIVLAAAVGVFFLPGPVPPLWARQVIAGCLLAGLLIWGLVRGVPWYRERRFLREHDGIAVGTAADQERGLAGPLVAAKEVILRSPNLRVGRDPLYRLPWYLVLGTDDADADGLLRAALADSPFPPPDATRPGGLSWRWWLYKGLVAIEASPTFVCDAREQGVRSAWYQALRLLDRHRPKLPVNGIALLLPAGALRQGGGGPELRETALRLRRLVDEVLKLLRVDVPVYLIVTRLDDLPGFDAFAAALPAEVRRQALGHRSAAGGRGTGAGLAEPLERVFDEVRGRLHALRLGLLKDLRDPADRRGVFAFVEAVAELRPGLREVAGVLLEENPYQRRPWLAGLYLGARSAFFADLFDRFLPADQPLAHKRRGARAASWAFVLGAIGLLAAASVYLTVSLLATQREDRALVAAAAAGCDLGEPAPAEAVARLARCRVAGRALAAAAERRRLDLGFGRLEREGRALAAGFLRGYDRLVLAPLDRALDADIAGGRLDYSHYLGQARRAAMLRACAGGDDAACGAIEPEPLLAATPAARLPALAPPGAAEGAAGLHRTALAWRDGAELERDLREEVARLERMLGARPPAVADLMPWLGDRAAPVELGSFWRREPRPPARADSPAVPAAFTRAAWESAVSPLLTDLEAVGLDAAADAFERDYLRRYLAAWRAFFARFDEGALLWSNDIPGLLDLLATEDGPYDRLWGRLRDDVFPLAERAPGEVWPAALRATLEATWPEAATKLRQLAFDLGRDREGAAALRLAEAAYGPPRPAARPDPQVEDLRRLATLLTTPPEDPALRMGAVDLEAWRVVRQPLEVLVHLTNHRAGGYLESLWRARVAGPAMALPAAERLSFLFGRGGDGRGGELAAFLDGWLGPFLADRDGMPAEAYGVTFPFAPEALAFLSEARRAAGEAKNGGAPIHAGTVRIAGPAAFGNFPEGDGGTVFTLSCLTREFRATNRGASIDEAAVTVFWSPDGCIEARLSVSLPMFLHEVDGGTPPVTGLVKRYAGPEGFPDFVREFQGGPRSLPIDAFAESVPPDRWRRLRSMLAAYGVGSVRVPIRVEPSGEMQAFLQGPRPLSVPSRLIDSPFG